MKVDSSPVLVSIIVPVYNAEKYLSYCLDSILSQTYRNIEVILVDDKSIDSSLSIAQEYSKKDQRVKLIPKDTNQGINSARSTGFKNATGNYIMFVDDDDIVADKLVDDHLCALRKTDADISISKAFWWDESEGLEIAKIYMQGSGNIVTLNKKLTYRSLITETSPYAESEVGMLWNKLHKRSFFEDYDWHLSDMPAEDFMTNAHLFDRLNKAVYIDRVHYFHRVSRNSTMGQLTQKKGANTRHKLDIFDSLYKVSEVFEKVSRANGWTFDKEIIYFKYRYFYIRINAFMSNGILSDSDFQKIKKYTSANEIAELCSSDFSRYISEFVYYPAVDVVREISNYWRDFSISSEQGMLFQKQINYLKSELRESGRHIEQQRTVISHQDSLLNYLQSIRGSMFNFLGKIKHKIIKQDHRFIRRLVAYFETANLERKYSNCWLVMDREENASDNGYVFYNHIIKNHPEINAYFAIQQGSIDVDRLQKQGFKLVFIGTKEHEIAVRNSSRLFYAYFTFEHSNDSAQRFFLGHGVTKDNLPNPGIRSTDYFITTLEKEQGFLSERVDIRAIKIGSPRYERLIMKASKSKRKKDKIIIAPTWRPWLYLGLGDIEKDGYVTNWQGFLNSKDLKNLSKKYELVFVLHPMMSKLGEESNSKLFDIPQYVDLTTYADLGLAALQQLLVESKLLITDFSSIAFDAALAGADVIYFQFDDEDFRAKGPLKTGWFNYDKDGFGPVCRDLDSLTLIIRHGLYTSKTYQRRRKLLYDEVAASTGISEKIIQLAKRDLS